MTELRAADMLGNLLHGTDDASPRLPVARGIGVRAALEEAMLPALQRPPCFVSFSGGRDSSAVLAVATAAARQHGLPDPVPATMRFPDEPQTNETRWQDVVLEHVGVAPEVVTLRHELDALGEIGVASLRRHGLLWPANAYLHIPLLERAHGGSLLTGVGGDELLDSQGSHFLRAALRRERPKPRDLAAAALAVAPRAMREAVSRRREPAALPWLTDAGRVLLSRASAADSVAYPRRWDRAVQHWARTRAYQGLKDSMTTVAAPYDVLAYHPLMDSRVMAELALLGGPAGWDSRTSAMTILFGDLLPDPVLARADKAAFSGPVWGPATRAFTAAWDGTGLDTGLVDVDGLRREWATSSPHFGSILLLQRAFLHRTRQAPVAP